MGGKVLVYSFECAGRGDVDERAVPLSVFRVEEIR